MELLYTGVAHPWLCDAMGHLTTRSYVAMFDDASYRLLFLAFGYAGPSGDNDGIGWADVKQTIQYQAEQRVGALIEVRGDIQGLGNKSVAAHYEMFNAANGECAATMDSVSVMFDLNARKAIPIPQRLRQRVAQSGIMNEAPLEPVGRASP